MAGKLTSTGLNKRQDTGKASFLYVGFGTGSQTPGESLVAMVAEIVRKAATVTLDGASISFTTFLNSNEGNDRLLEWGIWDALSSGNLLAYGTFDIPITKDNTEGQVILITNLLSNA